MSINIRAKGQNGEREIAQLLNGIIILTMREMGFPPDAITKAATSVQRNQNQSAVGGNDLSNTFGLSIEVKRQEQLSIDSWWRQCEAAAKRNNEWPVLLFRQNNRAWRCVTYGYVLIPDNVGRTMSVRIEIDYTTFQAWFKAWVIAKLKQGELVRT